MGTQIKNSDLIQPNLFKGTIEDAEALSKALDMIEAHFKAILKTTTEIANSTPLKSYSCIKKVTDSLQDANKAIEVLNKISSQRIKNNEILDKQRKENQKDFTKTKKNLKEEDKLKQQLIKGTDEEVKGRLKLQRVQKKQREELRDLIVLEDREAGLQEKIEAQNRILRRQRRNLTEDTQNYADVVADLNKQIDENNALLALGSDKQKQAKINVGNYTASLTGAIENSGILNDILGQLDGITAGFASSLVDVAKNTEDAGDSADKAGKRFGRLSKTIKASGIGAIVAVLGSITASFAATREAGIQFELLIQKATNAVLQFGSRSIDALKGLPASWDNLTLRVEAFFTRISNVTSIISGNTVPELEKIEKQIEANNKVIDKASTAFNGFFETLSEANSRSEDFLRTQVDLNDTIAQLNVEISKLSGSEQELQAIADDTTKSFNQQEEAQRKVLDITKERLALQREIAEVQLDQAVRAVQNELVNQNLQIEEIQIRNLKFLDDRNVALKISEDSVNSLSEAVLALQELENEELLTSINANRTIIEIRRDRFERELDFAIDAFDAVKTVNERIISSDKETLNQQAIIAEETRRLAQSSFEEQIKLVEGFTNERLNLNELVAIQDERIIRERLRQFELDDVTLGRILEILRERKAVTQDIADLENDIADKVKERSERELEASQALAEFRKDVEVTLAEEALEASEKAGNERLQLIEELAGKEVEAELLRRENLLSNTELIEDERQKIIEESEEKIRQIKKDSQEKQLKNEKESAKQRAEARKEIAETATKLIENAIKKQSEERLNAIDKDIDSSKKRLEQLEEFAQNNVQTTTDNLAFEQKKQAELQAQREKEIQKQKRQELALTAFKVYSSKVESGDKRPLSSTISDITLLSAFVNAIPQFYEGTNEKTVGDVLGNPDVKGKDGYIVRVDKDETILNPSKTKEYHSMLRNGAVSSLKVSSESSGLEKKLSAIESAIINKPAYMGRDYDSTRKAVTEFIQYRNKKIRNHKKNGGLF